MSNAPIGVFDSGVGGLSVLHAIRRELPGEDLLYIADSAHVPYGDKPATFIERRSFAIVEFLRDTGAKAIVVACNTATSAAVTALRERFSFPIVGMEPAVKPALAHTRSGVVGVLATAGTASSDKFAALLARVGNGTDVLVQPCPGFVETVERGELAGDAVYALVERTIAPLLQRGADVLVLGCTHYPFLRALIEQIAGPAVTVVDPSPAIARELRRRLADNHLLADRNDSGSERFWSSGSPQHAQRLIAQLWGRAVVVQQIEG
ncbi:MAG TPA: glutamate racemase [Burkholderiales bacterium]|nr:glutamate racemase [Burkholderiales bacterium]